MEKLQLNKRTIAQMDRMQMRNVKGGIAFDLPCLVSCNNGTNATKNCCRKRRPKQYIDCIGL